jgi:hypothetical protein
LKSSLILTRSVLPNQTRFVCKTSKRNASFSLVKNHPKKAGFCFFAFLILISFVPNAEAQVSARAMNPNIGANFLVGARQGTRSSDRGFQFEEAEFSFKSDVDPYFTANMIFSVAEQSPGSYGITPEEVYVDTTSLPGVTLRAGKFYNFFGKQNILHAHIFPFIDAPLISSALFGDGLNLPGISGSTILPTSFFSELTLQALGNAHALAHVRSLFETSDFSTLEIGVSGLSKQAFGLDLTFKYRPTDRGQGRRLNLAGEWMSGQVDGFTQIDLSQGLPVQGFDLYGQFEFISKTYLQYRFDDLISNHQTRHGVLLGYAPSEFSVLRIQGDRSLLKGSNPEYRVMAQANFTIGFHPAHDY